VIGRALSGELEGRTEVDYRPNGLRCRIEIKLSQPVSNTSKLASAAE
jgi:hypothetical protein